MRAGQSVQGWEARGQLLHREAQSQYFFSWDRSENDFPVFMGLFGLQEGVNEMVRIICTVKEAFHAKIQ